MEAKIIQERLNSLFADIEQIANQPGADETSLRRQVEALRSRVADLKPNLAPQTAPPNPPLLYEKERVGYAYTPGGLQPLAPTLLEEAPPSQALQVPLVQAEQTIGAMLLEPPPARSWEPEEEKLAQGVAQRATMHIQTLRLLQSAERARSEAQSATRRYIHESWDTFLDAIEHSERLGYTYDQSAVQPYLSPIGTGVDYLETISILGEHVGQVALQMERPLTEEEQTFVSAVARQVGQQVESLRLLSDASRARAQAEDATRQLTRRAWGEYTDTAEQDRLGYVYDSVQVSPLGEAPEPSPSHVHPLEVRGEIIGSLAVQDLESLTPEASQMIAAIAAQTSIHLETLRLNQELQKRAAELQELDRLKSAFLANMSHELRTPLNSILGFSEVMLEGIDGPLTDYMENDLKLIQKNGRHLLHLINDVLDMAKIEAGRMNLHLEKFRIQDVMEEVLGLTSSLASEKNISLFVEEDSDAGLELYADITRIRQVVINMVNNSIKFTGKGEIRLRADVLGADRALLRVRDTGIGVPPEQLESIFQEFSQVDSSTTRKAGGTGLGLPISRRLVEMHGGRMWAESTGIAGEGTTVFVELPLVAQLETEILEKPKG